MGALAPCELSHWGLRWSVTRGVPTWVRWRHANIATGAFGGAPYGATKRVTGVPKRARWRHANPATGAFGGALYGTTKRV
eukprot:228946-Pyramimonas_sp.AAC.1